MRFADRFIDPKRDLIVGVSVNNNPSVSDPWNTAPAWMQYVPAPSLTSSRFIDANAPYPSYAAGGNIGGVTAYAFWDRTIYAELGAYGTSRGALSFMHAGLANDDVTKLRGLNPYWRLTWNREWGPHSLMIGTAGMTSRIFDDPLDTSDPSTVHHNRDLSLDAQYQYLLDPHSVTAQLVFARNRHRFPDSLVGQGRPMHRGAVIRFGRPTMKYAYLVLALTGAALIAGCANPTRSRDLNNPPVAPATLAQQICSNCHGIAGVSVSPNFPNLAAQPVDYLVAQLKEFKSHNREDPAGFEYMWGISRSLTDDQIAGLAAYFSGQPPPRGPLESDANRRAAGKLVFLNGVPEKNIPACTTCHGDAGQGNATFPRLAGQHADYVIKQLVVFQRTNQRPSGAAMKTVAHDLNVDNIRNVAAYVQSLGNVATP